MGDVWASSTNPQVQWDAASLRAELEPQQKKAGWRASANSSGGYSLFQMCSSSVLVP